MLKGSQGCIQWRFWARSVLEMGPRVTSKASALPLRNIPSFRFAILGGERDGQVYLPSDTQKTLRCLQMLSWWFSASIWGYDAALSRCAMGYFTTQMVLRVFQGCSVLRRLCGIMAWTEIICMQGNAPDLLSCSSIPIPGSCFSDSYGFLLFPPQTLTPLTVLGWAES